MAVKGETAAMQLPQTKAESACVREMKGKNLANNNIVPELVTITMAQ